MQNNSIFCASSEKSTQLNTMALSLPPCSFTVVPGITVGGMWRWRVVVGVCTAVGGARSAHEGRRGPVSPPTALPPAPAPCALPAQQHPPPHTHSALTNVVGPDLQRLVLPHEQADAPVLLVPQQLGLPNPPLLPLPSVVVKAIQLAAPGGGGRGGWGGACGCVGGEGGGAA